MTTELVAEMRRVRRTGELIDRALFTVAGGALVFTSTNVTLFALAHGTPWFIGWLLDPLASVTMLAVLIGDGVLSRHGITAGRWPAVVKLGAGLCTWAMNVWSSVAAQDPAAVLLHSIAPGLLIGLAHAAPVYRIGFRTVLDRLAAQLDRTTGPPGTDRPPDRPGSIRSSRRVGARSGRRSAHRPAARSTRSIEQLRAELHAAIDAGRIDPRPSAEAVRRLLACAPVRARQLRDERAHHTDPAAAPAGSDPEGTGR
jgi:hypothetical protein